MSHIKTRNRWLVPFYGQVCGAPVTSQVFVAGTVILELFEVVEECTVDAVNFIKGATVAGNIRVGIYGPVVTEDTAEGAPLIVESDSVAMAATANIPQIVTFTATKLRKGRYYVAIQSDDSTATFMRYSNQTMAVGWSQKYARAGGYGAFTNPCPTITTDNGTAFPGLFVRSTA